MNRVQQCYEQAGGDYAAALEAYRDDSRIRRFVIRLAGDPSYRDLRAAMEAEDTEHAFRAAHSLKGVAMTLRMTALYEAASAVTEALRASDRERAMEDMPALESAYERTMEAVRDLAAEPQK